MYLKGVFLSALARHRIPISVLDAQAEQPAKSKRKKEKKGGVKQEKYHIATCNFYFSVSHYV